MPSYLSVIIERGRRQSHARVRRLYLGYTLGALAVLVAGLAAGLAGGCLPGNHAMSANASGVYPPAPQAPRIVALGTLRGAPPPSRGEVELALFLFGAEPAAPLTIATPSALAVHDGQLYICDDGVDAVFRWDTSAGRITDERFDAPLVYPFAIDIAPDGRRVICDRHGVRRFDQSGRVAVSYALEVGQYKPGGVLVVGDSVWVTNLATHCIEVFELATGRHMRTLGGPGNGPGRFALPRGLARMPDGNVCVVDLLNNRVQVLDADGRWVRNIGQAGDVAGCFGRPRDVTVGPDGTIFVTDAFAQRVQVFASDGQPLLSFGDPGSGIGELMLPSGIAISATAPPTDHPVPAGVSPRYFVLVAEQLDRPGVRVYAWLGAEQMEPSAALPTGEAVNWQPIIPGSGVINPHWTSERCTKCHKANGDRMLPIPAASIDPLCLSCHDGVQAPAEPHPIGRDGNTKLATTPDAFPTFNGRIGCLTCHDIQRHCHVGARRPATNTVLLREYDPQRPLEYCGSCHKTEVGSRFSPHRQRDATGKIREDACLFCHTHKPDVPADGRRSFQPHLRVESSQLCLGCHTRHWDLSPLGHVDRPVPPKIHEWMLMHELGREADGSLQRLAALAAEPGRRPALIPLGDGKVTCYSCHNPHYAGLFPPDSELGALATNPQDRKSALRTNWIDLCSSCHHR